MTETIESYFEKGVTFMNDAIDHLAKELTKIRAGKATPNMLDGIMVNYYDTPTPLNQLANIGTPDSRTLSIQPWDKSALALIEQGIFQANLGLTPQNDGEFIRITIPPVTEERRLELVKQAKALGEEGKISIRNARHKLIDFVKKEVKEGYPEDAGKRKEDEAQNLTNEYYKKIEQLIEAKEKDIMTV